MGILFHPQLWNPSLWTSSCVCVHGDDVVGATSCLEEREPQCIECGDLEKRWKKMKISCVIDLKFYRPNR